MLIDPRARMIEGPAGLLETLYQEADEPEGRFAAVVAHPHPLHGGTMMNKVVHRAAKALRSVGVSTLRFNFRGVGRSEGEHDEGRGEIDDYRTVLDELERLEPGVELIAAGFSFGSRVAFFAGDEDPRVRGLIGLGVPLSLYPDLAEKVGSLAKPAMILQGTEDEFTSAGDLRNRLREAVRPPVVFEVPGDHFFDGALHHLAEMIPWFVNRLENRPDSVDDRDPRLA